MELKRFSWISTASSTEYFQDTITEHFDIRNKSTQRGAPRSAVTMILQTASEILLYLPETLHKKNHPFNKMHAQIHSSSGTGACSTHSLSWKGGLHAPVTDCHGHLHQQINSSRAHSAPRKYMEIQHQTLPNSLKYCLMTSTRIQFPWDWKFMKLTLVETVVFFKFLDCERKKLQFS